MVNISRNYQLRRTRLQPCFMLLMLCRYVRPISLVITDGINQSTFRIQTASYICFIGHSESTRDNFPAYYPVLVILNSTPVSPDRNCIFVSSHPSGRLGCAKDHALVAIFPYPGVEFLTIPDWENQFLIFLTVSQYSIPWEPWKMNKSRLLRASPLQKISVVERLHHGLSESILVNILTDVREFKNEKPTIIRSWGTVASFADIESLIYVLTLWECTAYNDQELRNSPDNILHVKVTGRPWMVTKSKFGCVGHVHYNIFSHPIKIKSLQ